MSASYFGLLKVSLFVSDAFVFCNSFQPGFLEWPHTDAKLYDQVRAVETSQRRAWKLLGVPVSIRCLARALAIHERRLSATGRVDRRFKCTGAAPRWNIGFNLRDASLR